MKVGLLQKHLSSEVSARNYPLYAGLFVCLLILFGILLYFDSVLVFVLFSLVILVIGFTKPKWFLYIALTFFLSQQVFLKYPEEFYFGGQIAALTSGDLTLSFLRFASPENIFTGHLPKVFFLTTIVALVLPALGKNKTVSREKEFRYVFLFLATCLASAVFNLSVGPHTVLFLFQYLFPVAFYYSVVLIRMSIHERRKLFGYLMFLCFEVQVVFSCLQNSGKLLQGSWGFGDYAVGTFAYPQSQNSAVLLSIAIFFFLSDYLVHRNRKSLFKVFIAFMAILAASLGFFTLLLLLALIVYYLYGLSQKIVRPARVFRGLALTLVATGIPIMFIIENPERWIDYDYVSGKIQDNLQKRFTDIAKVFSFVNLYNMLSTEGNYALGSGPGTFLSAAAQKYDSPLYRKYSSFALLSERTGDIGGGDWLENSFVVLVGETGVIGWVLYMGFYYRKFKLVTARARLANALNERNELFAFLSGAFVLYLLSTFVLNVFEVRETILPLVVFTGLAFQEINSVNDELTET